MSPRGIRYVSTDIDASSLTEIVAQIAEGDESGYSALYALLQQGVRFFLLRRIGSGANVDDLVHDVFVATVEGIRRGSLRDPERLAGYVVGIARHLACDSLADTTASRMHRAPVENDSITNDTPEHVHGREERRKLLRVALQSLSGRDRELLMRFYLWNQSPEQICSEMSLSPDHFRVLKTKAKQRLIDRSKPVVQSSRRNLLAFARATTLRISNLVRQAP